MRTFSPDNHECALAQRPDLVVLEDTGAGQLERSPDPDALAYMRHAETS